MLHFHLDKLSLETRECIPKMWVRSSDTLVITIYGSRNLVHELDSLAHMGIMSRQDVIEAMELSVRDNPEARI